jgi:hypothetical protein
MEHVKTPVVVCPHWAQTDLVDATDRIVASLASGYQNEAVLNEIALALNAHDALVGALETVRCTLAAMEPLEGKNYQLKRAARKVIVDPLALVRGEVL